MLNLPALSWVPSPNFDAGRTHAIDLVVIHDCEGSYNGSINWFADPESQVSAHYVLSEDGTRATQMVRVEDKAWHVRAFNGRAIGVEMGGFAAKGFSAAEWGADAAIAAYLLRRHGLPCRWAEHGAGPGFCSHYDLGPAGGGHRDPTTDPVKWAAFAAQVAAAYAQPMPASWAPPFVPSPAPPRPVGFVPTPTLRR